VCEIPRCEGDLRAVCPWGKNPPRPCITLSHGSFSEWNAFEKRSHTFPGSHGPNGHEETHQNQVGIFHKIRSN